MCEPTLSVTQFPPDDTGSGDTRLGLGLSKVFEWGKKILGRWHFCKLGAGHSESMNTLNSDYLPQDTKFEAKWWNRTVRLDGVYSTEENSVESSLEAAEVYSSRVCLGNLTLLRNFLEVSMKKTFRHYAYVDRFHGNFLNKKGQLLFEQKIKKALQVNHIDWLKLFHRRASTNMVDAAIKIMLGMTRHRECICPEWADDAVLWKQPKIILG